MWAYVLWCLDTETWLPQALYKYSVILIDLSQSGMTRITYTIRNNILLYFKIPLLLLCNIRRQMYSLICLLFFLYTVFSCPNFIASAPFQQDSCRIFFSTEFFLSGYYIVHIYKCTTIEIFLFEHVFVTYSYRVSFLPRNTFSLFSFNRLIW
jgi:hypothetical protein